MATGIAERTLNEVSLGWSGTSGDKNDLRRYGKLYQVQIHGLC